MNIKTVLIAGALAALSVGAVAQTATPGANQRQSNQEKRIEAGEKSGALNATEANRLEKQQKIADNVEAKAKADGVVTKGERVKMHKVEKKTSKDIYKQKHDANTAN
ncbi:MAG: hypothetical protein JSR59_02950 [Proteobacteria bacterium]|nr:hypothetical protein [Pseudomonadota bacterium]